MGGGWPARRSVDDFDDIEAWMAQRNADVAQRQDAEDAGRAAWDQATRSGQDLAAAQPGDLVAIGAGVLNQAIRGWRQIKRARRSRAMTIPRRRRRCRAIRLKFRPTRRRARAALIPRSAASDS
jgi:hypothetical protein